MNKRLLGLLIVGVLASAPAQAHPAAPPAEYQVRLLADYSDDYFGGDVVNGVGYDLHALDVQEIHDERLGDSLRFLLVLNGEGETQIRMTFNTPGGGQEFGWDHAGGTWRVVGFDAGGNAGPDINAAGTGQDGDRINLEGMIALGNTVQLGDALTDFQVVSRNGGNEGDALVRCDSLLGTCQEGSEVPYTAGPYSVAGPVQYVRINISPASEPLRPGQEALLNLEVKNLLSEAQEVGIDGSAVGLDLRFHDPGSGAYSAAAQITLAAGASTIIHAAVTPQEEAPVGSLLVAATSQLGGRSVDEISMEIQLPEPSPSPTPDDHEHEPTPIGAVAPLALLLALACRRFA